MRIVRVIDRVIVSCIASIQLLCSLYLLILFGRASTIVFAVGSLGFMTALGLFTGHPAVKWIALVWQAIFLQYTWGHNKDVLSGLVIVISMGYLALTALFIPFKSKTELQPDLADSTAKKGLY